MKKYIILFFSLFVILGCAYNNALNVYASDDESDIALVNNGQIFSYTYAGMTYTSNISLDDAWKKAMISQYELGRIGLDDIEIDYGLYNTKVINIFPPHENEGDSSRNPEEDGIKIHLEWQPSLNVNYIPLKYMKVQLYYIYYNNDSPLTTVKLDEGYTDANGDYIFTNVSTWIELLHPFSSFIDQINGVELCVRIFPESTTFKVQKDWLSLLNFAGEALADWSIVDGIIEEFLSYSVITDPINVGYLDRNGDFGTIQIPYRKNFDDSGELIESNLLNNSFKVAQSLAMAQKFINDVGISITNKVNVAYPAFYGTEMNDNAFCYYDYDFQSGLMCIGGLRDDWETMLHEYGHFVQGSLDLFPFSWTDYASYYISSFLGLDGGVNPEHNGDEDHISDPEWGKGKDIGTKFAWSEGWAESFSYIVQDYYWNNYYLLGENLITTGLEGVKPLDTSYSTISDNSCEGQEVAITIFLNNIYNLQIDGLEMFLSSINPGDINGEKIQTISKFVDNLLIKYPEYHEEIGNFLSNGHISSSLYSISTFDTYNPPEISWLINGSEYTPLNQFEIKVYDVNGNEKYSINNINTSKAYNDVFQFEIPFEEWMNILYFLGNSPKFGIEIYCYNTTDMLSGPYPSNRVICDTPYFFDLVFNETTDSYEINGVTNIRDVNSILILDYFNNKKITKINDSAFLNYKQLSHIELPSYLEEIGPSAFKECRSLTSITIPDNVTNIDSSAFENCTQLKSIALPTNLEAIGISAFKGCIRLKNITIPSSVQYIDESAFENCRSLDLVVVERALSNITNLGNNVFDGCSSSLQIVVPQNRLVEYKNKVYWSSYKNIIVPDSSIFDEMNLHCLVDNSQNVTLNAGYNKLYKLDVDCTKSYKFTVDNNTNIIIYNSDLINIYSGENTLTAYLNKGSYYLSVELSSSIGSETIKISYRPTYPTDGLSIAYNSSGGMNILSGLHLTENNMYHVRLKYSNNQDEGIYKFILNAGNNAIYPEHAIQVYTDVNRNNLLSMYSVSEISKLAQSNENENIMYINLTDHGIYYIDVTLPSNNYSVLTFNIESIEINNIDYTYCLSSISFDVLFESKDIQSYFEEVKISHRSEIQLDIVTNGTINNNIKVYVFKKLLKPGYDIGVNYYYIETVYVDEITSTNRCPVFTMVLDPGTYYFGYAENEDNVSINFALKRMVTYNENMQGVLVADPYHTGYELGSEVLFNNGECNNYTITEGFTRNIYLMVEDRLHDPMSRLDYDWYSSNESVATVTNYGIVVAMRVTEDKQVTIYAVLKDDPKIVYYRTFTILNDEGEALIEIELEMSYSYDTDNGTYQLELNSTNCPYPMIQYYSWNITTYSDETVTMNDWGQITSTGRCDVNVVGTYYLNHRVRLYIALIIE